MKKPHHVWRTCAFTLTELLVSMAILSGLIVLMFSVVDGTTKTWNQSEQRVDAFREARAALSIISRDLQSVVPAPDVGPQPYPTPTPTPAPGTSPYPTPTPVPTPDGIADFQYFFVVNDTQYLTTHPEITFPQPSTGAQLGTRGNPGSGESDALFFMTALPVTAQVPNPSPSPAVDAKSDVSLVGYYQRYDSPTSASSGALSTFKLYRYLENSDASFIRIKKFTANPQANTLISAPSVNDEVLARNVIDFRVKAYDEAMINSVPWDSQKTPFAVDLSITAFNYSAASRFIDRADWMNFTSSKNSPSRQTFSTRVYLTRGTTPSPSPTP